MSAILRYIARSQWDRLVSLVLEDSGSENEAMAALLHDAVEDQGRPKNA
jgi:hypothetical protein